MKEAADLLNAMLAALAPASHGVLVPLSGKDWVAPTTTRWLYIGGAGDVKLDLVNNGADSTLVFKALLAGTLLPVQASKIYSTGTTAPFVIALW